MNGWLVGLLIFLALCGVGAAIDVLDGTDKREGGTCRYVDGWFGERFECRDSDGDFYTIP